MLNLDYKEVAEKYGGNKQKIAEAAALGALGPEGPLLAVTAGMYIDKMRAAQQMEQAPQQTVAQQVLTPQPQPQPQMQPPAAGLGAIPPQGAPAPQPQMPPQGVPGMAEGGMVPPYASGGLSGLPIPDGMFDESRNGGFNDGYAGGGLVAFAAGDLVDEDLRAAPAPEVSDTGDEMVLNSPARAKPPVSLGGVPMFDMPDSLYGYSNDFFTNLNRWKEMYSPETKQRERVAAALEESMSPEAQKRARKEDMWATLGQIGARMATTPGSVLQAAATGIGEALPGARAAAKERKAEVRSALKELAQQEGLTNQEALAASQMAMDMKGKYATLAEAMQDRAFKDRWGKQDRDVQLTAAKLASQASMFGARTAAGASMYGSRLGLQGQQYAANAALERDAAALREAAAKAVSEAIGLGGPNYGAYRDAVKAGTGNRYIESLMEAYTGASAGGGNTVSVPWNP